MTYMPSKWQLYAIDRGDHRDQYHLDNSQLNIRHQTIFWVEAKSLWEKEYHSKNIWLKFFSFFFFIQRTAYDIICKSAPFLF